MGIESLPALRIEEFCKKWELSQFAVFGSILRADFRPDSDVDVMVQFAPSSPRSLFEMARMQRELEEIFGRKVDLVSRRGLELSENKARSNAILKSAKVLYAA